jgi:hypothetical protein
MNQQTTQRKSQNPYERRIARLLFFMFTIIGISVFFLGVNPRIFGYEFKNIAVSRFIAWTLALAIIGIGIMGFDLYQSLTSLHKRMSWWRVVIYGWSVGIILGILISCLPYFSLQLYILSLIWTLMILCIFFERRTGSFLLRLILISNVPNVFFILGTRLWIDLIGFHWGWFITLLGCYLFSWSIPKLLPRLSKFLYREQTSPRTTIEKILYRLAFILIPSASSSALIGMYMNRYFGERVSLLIVAVFSSVLSIFMAQPLSHQLFNKKSSESISA